MCFTSGQKLRMIKVSGEGILKDRPLCQIVNQVVTTNEKLVKEV